MFLCIENKYHHRSIIDQQTTGPKKVEKPVAGPFARLVGTLPKTSKPLSKVWTFQPFNCSTFVDQKLSEKKGMQVDIQRCHSHIAPKQLH